MDDSETIERATLAAVPPQELREHAGWLVPFDDGTVGRAHSAAPLRHVPADPGIVEDIAALYRGRGHVPVFRVPDLATFEGLHGELRGSGRVALKPTLVQAAPLDGLLALPVGSQVTLSPHPGDAWADVFLGEGFDPADGASRLAILRRARGAVFASVVAGDRTVAVGSGCFAHGWCGIHGMRTAPAARGRGHASAILSALAREAAARGVRRAFLQVEEENGTAQALYARAGFATLWRYRYWR
jgi:ribosomal protein S18 acetylase RimI-like enzyme